MLSEALRLLRVFHDLKQNELADKLDVSKSYISEIEKGRRTPSLETIEKYSKYFRIPTSSILFFSEQIEDAQTIKGTATKAKEAIASKIVNFLQVIEERTELDGA